MAESKNTPKGSLNVAKDPCPFAHPAADVPARVVTFQMHDGCALNPVIGQAVAGEQGAQAAVPFAYVPIGQVVDVKAHDVAPWVLKDPGLQGKHTADEFAPVATENVPAAQGTHVELITAPTTVL